MLNLSGIYYFIPMVTMSIGGVAACGSLRPSLLLDLVDPSNRWSVLALCQICATRTLMWRPSTQMATLPQVDLTVATLQWRQAWPRGGRGRWGKRRKEGGGGYEVEEPDMHW